jgi:hypothetical protein
MTNYVKGQKYFIAVDSLDGYGVVDTNNIIKIDFNFINIIDKGNYLLVIDSNHKKGVYDKNMNMILPVEFNDIKANCSDWIVGKKDKYYEYFDSTGIMILSNNYMDATPFRNDSAIVMFKDSNEIIIVQIDRKGDFIEKGKHFDLSGFSNSGCIMTGGIRVINGLKKKRKYYGIFYKDTWLIEPKYDFIEGTLDYFYIVKSGDYYGVVNNEGKFILPTIYKKINSKY